MPSAALPLPPRQQTYVQPWHRQNQRGLRQYVRYSCFPPSICAICAVLILQYVRYSSFHMCGAHPSPRPPPDGKCFKGNIGMRYRPHASVSRLHCQHMSRVYIASLACSVMHLSCICHASTLPTHASVTRLHCVSWQHTHRVTAKDMPQHHKRHASTPRQPTESAGSQA